MVVSFGLMPNLTSDELLRHMVTINCGLSRWCPQNKVGVMDKTPIDTFYDCMCFQCWLVENVIFFCFVLFLIIQCPPIPDTNAILS